MTAPLTDQQHAVIEAAIRSVIPGVRDTSTMTVRITELDEHGLRNSWTGRVSALAVRINDRIAQDLAGDEWVRCSLPHCPNGERYQYAQQHGWTPQHMGTWHCAEHSPACTCGARPVHQTGCDTDQDN